MQYNSIIYNIQYLSHLIIVIVKTDNKSIIRSSNSFLKKQYLIYSNWFCKKYRINKTWKV